MKTYKDVLVAGSSWQVSLVKLAGKKIAEITGHISEEFGDPVFQMHSIVFEDGSEMGCEGEHDIAYLTNYKNAVLSEEQLQHLVETQGYKE